MESSALNGVFRSGGQGNSLAPGGDLGDVLVDGGAADAKQPGARSEHHTEIDDRRTGSLPDPADTRYKKPAQRTCDLGTCLWRGLSVVLRLRVYLPRKLHDLLQDRWQVGPGSDLLHGELIQPSQVPDELLIFFLWVLH